MKVQLEPKVLRWARVRAGLDEETLGKRVGIASNPADRVAQWEQDGHLTYRQAETLAQKTHVPLGYLFLPEPPVEHLPINDFRTVGSTGVDKAPSPELLDVIYDALRKQSWYRDYRIDRHEPPLDFVGSASEKDAPTELAGRICAEFGLGPELRTKADKWEISLRLMFEVLEEKGILLLRSGVVAGNPHRPLAVEEFRGFAISDAYAPVIFINSRDSKAGQMFTTAHELVHLWLGSSGVSLLGASERPMRRIEAFCNTVAAEILVPAAELRAVYPKAKKAKEPIAKMTRHFKVSSLVILRRLFDLQLIDGKAFRTQYQAEETKFRKRKERQQEKSGGNYYATQKTRAGHRFARDLIAHTLEGSTSYRDAYTLLGIKKTSTFQELARQLDFQIR